MSGSVLYWALREIIRDIPNVDMQRLERKTGHPSAWLSALVTVAKMIVGRYGKVGAQRKIRQFRDERGLDAVARIFELMQAGYFDNFELAGGLVNTVKQMFAQAEVNAHRRMERQADYKAASLNREEIGALVEYTRPNAEVHTQAVEAVIKFYVEKCGEDLWYQHVILGLTYDELAEVTERPERHRKRQYSISGIRKKAEKQGAMFVSMLVMEWAIFEKFCLENGYPASVTSYVGGILGV